ncbi:MAG TPA: glycosyltransferase [Longimicrobiaceae bacterium]|nr:glycosyltransferase [Longimicrobiaceae bacterium]
MRVALVHDWLTGMRGGERVLEGMLDLFPGAEIFTLLHVPGSVSGKIEARPIHTSALEQAPFARRRYRGYLPLFPLAVESLRVRGFDLVLSSSHCVAKAVRTGGAPHLCYCHTPMRYVWDQFDSYFSGGYRRLLRGLAAPVAGALRRWDAATSRRVHAFVANSSHVRDRIRRSYGRDAAVVHPPVEVARFRQPRAPEDFYLVVSALVPYKRVALAVRACTLLGRRLVVAGDGPEAARLRRIAGPTVAFLGRVSDEEVADLYSRCRALLFPGVEDFGITAVEAQAAGAPVVALAAGGLLETVSGPRVGTAGEVVQRPDSGEAACTGVFFTEPSAEAMAAALLHLERMEFDEDALRRNAERFAPPHFHEGMLREVVRLLTRQVCVPEPARQLLSQGTVGPTVVA